MLRHKARQLGRRLWLDQGDILDSILNEMKRLFFHGYDSILQYVRANLW